MMLVTTMASGVPPDAISMWDKIVSWLMASRTDSAAWAIAFTVNTWAASIKSARSSVYEGVHALFSAYKSEIRYAQWLEKAESMTDDNGHKEFRSRMDRLLEYINRKDAKFLNDTKAPDTFVERVMWCAAMMSVLVIVFEWYYNYLLALLLPYPLFCFWQSVRGRWGMIRVWWLRRSAIRSLVKIEKRCGGPSDEPPSISELKKKLAK